ncbi:MAG TPA: hypothetical protein VD903_21400, partial [Pseudonocardia sp.]|nr:hypothetical protein [Pseudonocardia sp.]
MRTGVRPSWWAGVLPTVVLPVAVAVITLAGTGMTSRFGTGLRPLDVLGELLLLAGPAALVVRRWNPPAVFAGVAAALVLYLAAGYPFGPAPL